MCGINGLISLTYLDKNQRGAHKKWADRMIAQMGKAIAHRGPDQADAWHSPDGAVTLGHRRLSILDLSEFGRQPMASHCGRYHIVFNGEIYNFASLKQNLSPVISAYNGHSDTEILLEHIVHFGLEKTLSLLNGMFAFVIHDQKTGQIDFARDRFGKKPLYIGVTSSAPATSSPPFIAFSSEVKAFRAIDDFPSDMNQHAVSQYLQFGYIAAPASIYSHIASLPPGHFLSLNLNELHANTKKNKGAYLDALTCDSLIDRAQPYWSPLDVAAQTYHGANTARPDHDIHDQAHDLMQDAVAIRMMADVPIGCFLSGGLDSTLVTAMMARQSSLPVNSFSIAFHDTHHDISTHASTMPGQSHSHAADDHLNEAHHARAIATYLGTHHHEIAVTGQDALDIIPNLPHIYDEPFADPSQIPSALLCAKAKPAMTVALTGDGGDEIFGGYQRYLSAPAIWGKIGHIPAPLRRLIAGPLRAIISASPSLLGLIGRDMPEFNARMHKLIKALPAKDFQDFYLHLLRHDNQNISGIRLNNAVPSFLSDALNLATTKNFTPLQTMILGDVMHYLPNDILTKIDRAAMAASLETRAPFLDYRLFEFMAALPDDFKIRTGATNDPNKHKLTGKYMIRQALTRYFPGDNAQLYQRPKQGFTPPIAKWLRGDLRDWGQHLIDQADQAIFNRAALSEKWDHFQKGDQAHLQNLWAILMFENWRQTWTNQ